MPQNTRLDNLMKFAMVNLAKEGGCLQDFVQRYDVPYKTAWKWARLLGIHFKRSPWGSRKKTMVGANRG